MSYSSGDETWATLGGYQDGFDKIVIESGTDGVSSFTDVKYLLVQDGNNVKIAFADLPDIMIEDTELANIDTTDFIFTPDSASTSAMVTTSLSVNSVSVASESAAGQPETANPSSARVSGFARWFGFDSLEELKANMKGHSWFNDAAISPLPAKVPASNLEVMRSASRFSEALAGFAADKGLGDLLSHKEWQASNHHFFAASRM